MSSLITVLAASSAIQIAAAGLSIRRRAVGRRRSVWLVLAAAFSALAVRSLYVLAAEASGPPAVAPTGSPLLLSEAAGLLASLLALAGVALASPAQLGAQTGVERAPAADEPAPRGAEPSAGERAERLFAGGPVAVVCWRASDRAVTFVTANVAAWGFDPAALVAGGGSVHEHIHPVDAGAVSAALRMHLDAGDRRWEQEYRLVCPDGKTRRVIECTVVAGEEGGVPDRFDAYLLDVTAHRETEAALCESEERFRLAGVATRELIYDWDVAEGTRRWSGTGGGDLGLAAEELGGDRSGWEARIHPHDRDRVRDALDRALAGAPSFEAEYRFRRGDGGYAVAYDRGVIVRDEGGTARRMVGALIDLTRQRRLEDQLTLSRRLEAVGSLAGGIAHDFNNLLTAIMAASELLELRLAERGEAPEELGTIKRTATRAAGLTHALLAFARRQVLRPVTVDLGELVEGVLPVLRRVLPEGIGIEVVPGSELAAVRVDRAQIEQIIMNLCLNARDAMPAGGTITIETANALIDGEFRRLHPWAKEGRYVKLSLADTGVGMDPETLQHIFEPFFTTKRLGGGVGLGLATVYGIVKQHEGMISMSSEPNAGTTATIYLPVAGSGPEGEASGS